MKKILFLIAIGIVLLMPSASFAIEEKFFEFATDVGMPINVPTGSVATQEFKILNDSINAVDVWFDNTGSSGSVTFGLYNAANALLVSRTMTVGHIDPFYAGQRLHVNFNKTIEVTSGALYTLKITSALPALRLYSIARVQFVEHNAPYVISDAIGATTVNGDPLLSVLKFALYEENDSEAPVITNATSTLRGVDTVRILFNASELIDYSLSYGLLGALERATVEFKGIYSICFEGVRDCFIDINTQSNAIYNYRLITRDSWGNESYVDGVFESWKSGAPVPQPPADTPPSVPQAPTQPTPQEPLVQAFTITNARVVAVTDRSVQMAWTTNRAANSILTISTDSAGINAITTTRDDARELEHIRTSDAVLLANRTYYAIVTSYDANGAMAAQMITFSTTMATTNPLLATTPSASTPLSVSISDEQQSLAITWNALSTGEPNTGYRVDIIDGKGSLARSMALTTGTHSAVVENLEGGEYHAVVYADNQGVLEKVAAPAAVIIRKTNPPIDTYELIQKPIVYIPSALFVMLIAGLYWYSKKDHLKK